jgi:hypothetical protein
MDSFLAVTGPKRDLWLVCTVAVLIVALALTLLIAAFRDNVSLEIFILTLGSAIAFGTIDVVYMTKLVR